MADGTHIDLGHAMITMVEPTRDPERLREYNRWYEHDHAYSGVLVGPWAFSFGRFVATKDLKQLRAPDTSTVADPQTLGTFIGFYWYLADRIGEHFAWAFPQTQWLGEQGRMNDDREHVSTSLYEFRGAVNRPGWPVPPEIALDHPYAGVVVAWIDRAPDASYDDLAAWVRETWLPARLTADGAAGQALVFAPCDFPNVPGSGVGVGERLLVAFFLTADPRAVWAAEFADLADAVAASGLGTLGLAAAFVPTVPGTDTYLDDLW
jgi:hypothetical protein